MDTIFARATVPGKSGVAIIRVSGPSAFEACRRLAGPLPDPQTARIRTIRRISGEVIDRCLVLPFQEDASFTGEQTVEFQTHGSPAVISALLGQLAELSGLRPADAGEFTRRALQNERMDMAQVEGLADLIDAETDLQLEQARRVFAGELSDCVQTWRTRLIGTSALLAATLDFSEEDIPANVWPDVCRDVRELTAELDRAIDGFTTSERIRDGFEVAIVGEPNTGKSTLLNAIAKRPVALISELAGTTRDVIELRTDLNGLPITFLDTAGLRDATDAIEIAGIELARDRSRRADLRLYLTETPESVVTQDAVDIVVRCKVDILPHSMVNEGVHCVSGTTGLGISALLDQVSSRLGTRNANGSLFTRSRHIVCLRNAKDTITMIEWDSRHETPFEIAAETLSVASTALGEIIGRIDVEDVLDEIFTSFCIGK